MEFELPEHPGRTFRAHNTSVFWQFGAVNGPRIDEVNNINRGMELNNNDVPFERIEGWGGVGGRSMPRIVDFLYPPGGWISEAQAHEYYDTVKNRVLNDPAILPGDTFYQTVFFPSDVMSGEDEPYEGEGLCFVYIDSDGNKAFGEVMHMEHRRIASLYRVLLERNPNFFRIADREISDLVGPSLDYLVEENRGGPLRIMETIARRAIRQDGGRRRRRRTQTRHRRNASHRRAANRRSKTRRS